MWTLVGGGMEHVAQVAVDLGGLDPQRGAAPASGGLDGSEDSCAC
jgi:hypothetical protein